MDFPRIIHHPNGNTQRVDTLAQCNAAREQGWGLAPFPKKPEPSTADVIQELIDRLQSLEERVAQLEAPPIKRGPGRPPKARDTDPADMED